MKYNKQYAFLLGALIGASAYAPHTLADSPVFYGRINLSLEQSTVEVGPATTKDQWELNSNASRLGVRGTAPLSEGLTAIYGLEYEINAASGADGSVNATVPATAPSDVAIKSSASPFSQRNTFVGVRGSFGEVKAGKLDTPLKSIEGKVDQFNDLKGDIDNLIGGQNRPTDVIQYTSPKVAEHVTLNLALVLPEGADVDSDGKADTDLTDSVSLSAVFDNKTIYAALAIDQSQPARRTVDGIGRADAVRLVGGWKIDEAFEVGALFQQTSDVVSGSSAEDTSYLLSGAYKNGNYKFKAQYGLSNGKVGDEEGTLLALGVDYALAKSTTLYTYISNVDKDKADSSDQTLALGLSHSF